MKRTTVLLILLLPAILWAQSFRFYEFDFHVAYPDSLNLFAATSNVQVQNDCANQLTIPDSLRMKHINGLLGHGVGDNNPVYSWQFVRNEWQLADVSLEACDGMPLEDVEADTAYWIGTMKRFCPWTSFVKREVIMSEVADARAAWGLAVGPLPCRDVLTIRNEGPATWVLRGILDLEGRVVQDLGMRLIPSTRLELPVQLFPAGAYFLLIQGKGGYELLRVQVQD